MKPVHGGQHWIEAAGSGVAQTARASVIADDGSSRWDVRTGVAQQVAALDLGDGQFLTIQTDDPWIIIDDGTQYLVSHTGTEAAVLADDGSGGLIVQPIGATVAGQFLLDAGSGDIVPVRNDAPELRFIELAATAIVSFPPSA